MTVWDDPDEILAQFRRWVESARQEANQLTAQANGQATTLAIVRNEGASIESEGSADPAEQFGLIRLVEEFTALRHEVKLQTKSSRGLQEQTEAALGAMDSAIQEFRSVAPREAQAALAAEKPWAEAIAELDDSLERGRQELERLRTRLVEQAASELEQALEKTYGDMPGWRRWLCRSYHAAVLTTIRHQADAVHRPALESLIDGYRLIQGRLERAMKQQQLERLTCLGKLVDPHAMTVVEVVEAPALAPGTVVAELRRGYRWQGAVLRFAEVQAVRG